MQRIRNYFDMMTRILRQESDGDLMDYLQNINSPDEAMEVIKTLRDKLVDMSMEEMNKEMGKFHYDTKTELMARFEFIIEKQRNYPLGMGEYGDLEEWAESWAEDNGYGFLFQNDYLED